MAIHGKLSISKEQKLSSICRTSLTCWPSVAKFALRMEGATLQGRSSLQREWDDSSQLQQSCGSKARRPQKFLLVVAVQNLRYDKSRLASQLHSHDILLGKFIHTATVSRRRYPESPAPLWPAARDRGCLRELECLEHCHGAMQQIKSSLVGSKDKERSW